VKWAQIIGVLSSDTSTCSSRASPHRHQRSDAARQGRSSYKIQMEFPEIRKRYWGRDSGREDISHDQWEHH
jgi:hypothetical protein